MLESIARLHIKTSRSPVNPPAAIVLLTGIFPTILAATGVTRWLGKRADRKAL
jgi:hypothetical protein